jgi:methionyl-tRNA synthetase
MPEKAAEMWRRLGAPGRVEDQRWESLMKLDAVGSRVTKGDPLFPKPATTES